MKCRTQVRFAKESDYPAAKKFDQKITAKQFRSKLGQKEILVATRDREVVGYLRLEQIWLKVPYISWIMVHESHRELGIASELTAWLRKHLKKRGRKFILSSFQDNARIAARWHRRMGFERNGSISRVNDDGSKEIFCRLSI